MTEDELTSRENHIGTQPQSSINNLRSDLKKIREDIAAVGGGGTWGDITGTLSDQTDLQTALDAKKTNSMSTNKLLGRGTAATGAIEEITLGTNLSFTGTTLNASGGGGVSWGGISGTLSTQTDLQTALNTKVDENAAITGATKTKITYDVKGLVTAGADATTADIADSSNKRYVTDANLTVIGNTSGTNSGNETTTTAGALINSATGKTTPVDADYVGLMDSAASNILKKLSWANIKATLKTYFDGIYGTGHGDMLKSVYDTNEDDRVDMADDSLRLEGNPGAYHLDRANHTGTQAQSTVTNLVTDLAAKQPLDADLTTIAGLTATTNNFIQSVSSAWASRTPAQVKTSLSLIGGSFMIGGAVASYVASTTYYIGSLYSVPGQTFEPLIRMYPPMACTIKAVNLTVYNGTGATAGNVAVSIRKNNSGDTPLTTTMTWMTTGGSDILMSTGLSVALNGTTDFFSIKIVTPAWATAPVNTRITGIVYYELN